jgi:hypothetical protein
MMRWGRTEGEAASESHREKRRGEGKWRRASESHGGEDDQIHRRLRGEEGLSVEEEEASRLRARRPGGGGAGATNGSKMVERNRNLRGQADVERLNQC